MFLGAPCGGAFENVESATIKSPASPNNYPDHIDCEWTVSVPDGKQIQISFTAFSVSKKQHICSIDCIFLSIVNDIV